MSPRLALVIALAATLAGVSAAVAQEPAAPDFAALAAAYAPRRFDPAEAPPKGLVAVHRCITTNLVSKARVTGLGVRQDSTVTTRFEGFAPDSSAVLQTLHVTTGDFVEEYRVTTPLWWLPYGVAAKEERIAQAGTISGFRVRGTVLTEGRLPELTGPAALIQARITEEMDWATEISNAETQFTHFSTPKVVSVSVAPAPKINSAAAGEAEGWRVTVQVRDAESPARQEWTRDYVPSLWVPLAFTRLDVNVRNQPVRELKCELVEYRRP